MALILLLLAVAVAAGSLALFTSSSANASNVASAGSLSQDNSKKGAAILTVTKLVPDATGTVTIQNTGDVDGTFRLSHTNLRNFNGSGAAAAGSDPKFSDVLNLTVRDSTTSKTIYDGPIAALGTSTIDGTSGAGNKWKPGESHDFTFTIHFVPTTNGTDNDYQGTKTTVQYNWDATS